MKDKVLPHDVDAEKAVLCACLIKPEIISQVADVITPDDFYREAHKIVSEALYSLKDASGIITLANWLTSRGQLEKIGGQSYLADLSNCVYTSAGWRYHADIIRAMAQRRKLILECMDTAEACYELHRDVPEILQGHESQLQAIEQGSQSQFRAGVHISNVYTPARMLEAYREHIKGLKQNRFITGIHEIDRRIRGVAGGEVLAVIARAGSFKTAWLQNMLRGYIHNSRWGALFFEIEMPISSITERYHEMIQGTGGKEIEEFYTTDLEGVGLYRQGLEDAFTKDLDRLFVVPSKVGTREIVSYLNLIQKQHQTKIGVIGIDYLGLMSGDGKGEYEIVTNLTREIKSTAKLVDLPVVLVSQVSRRGGSGDVEIELDMGRGSGAIEENADFVLGLWQDGEDLICKILKNRKGSKGQRFKLDLNPETLVIGREAEFWTPPRKSKKKEWQGEI